MLLLLAACAGKTDAPVQLSLDCSRGFEALKAEIVAAAGSAGASKQNEPLSTYFVDRGRSYYSVSKAGLPGHPMIFLVTSAADGREKTSGCGYGDQEAYRKALRELSSFVAVD